MADDADDPIVELTWVSRDAEADAILALLSTQGIVAYSRPVVAHLRGGVQPRPIMVLERDLAAARALLDGPAELPAEFSPAVWESEPPSRRTAKRRRR